MKKFLLFSFFLLLISCSLSTEQKQKGTYTNFSEATDVKESDVVLRSLFVTNKVKDCHVSFDPRWLIDESADNKKYSEHLAVFSSLLSMDAYGLFGETGDIHRKAGMKDVKTINTKNTTSYILGKDKTDVASFVISHKDLIYKEKKYNIVLLSVRGTDTAEQWYSDIDLGAEGKYEELTGKHPLWKDKTRHKGFEVTSYRVHEAVNMYLNDYLPDGGKRVFLVTGHSRGAAVANIIGCDYESDSSVKSFTYTFACPGITTNSTEKCSTIFNFCNTDDVVTSVPPSSMGFVRYGKDIKIDMANDKYYNGRYLSSVYNEKTMESFEYQPCYKTEWDGIISSIAPNREALYTIENTKAVLPGIVIESLKLLDSKLHLQITDNSVQVRPSFLVYTVPLLYKNWESVYPTVNTLFNALNSAGQPKYKNILECGIIQQFKDGVPCAHDAITYAVMAESYSEK